MSSPWTVRVAATSCAPTAPTPWCPTWPSCWSRNDRDRKRGKGIDTMANLKTDHGTKAGAKAAAPTKTPLTAEALRLTHAYWRACNYLAVGMIYLRANPLLTEPLQEEH